MNEEKFAAAYAKLNDAQKKAVDTTEGPVMVVAGPGTGKTELLALRVTNILRKKEVVPHNILCLTFTENGAMNMRERLKGFLGQDAYRVGIYTFHAFANSIIARFPEYFYNAATFTQATDLDRARITEEIFRGLPHNHPLASFHPEEGFVYLRDTLDRIKHIKSGGYTPEEYEGILGKLEEEFPEIDAALSNWPQGRMTIKKIGELDLVVTKLKKAVISGAYLAKELEASISLAQEMGKMEPVSKWKTRFAVVDDERLIYKDSYQSKKIRAVSQVYRLYTEMLHKEGLYDFDDVILEVTHVLRENSVLTAMLEEEYQYILVDEFQDTNQAQMDLVHAISESYIHEERPNIMVVGDDDQAIYKFQGAEISNIIDFSKGKYRDVTTIILDKNYRSHQDILDFARNIITQGEVRLENRIKNISKVLTQGNDTLKKGKISIQCYATDVDEYHSIANEISELLLAGVPQHEIAILGRSHKEIRKLLPYLDKKQIPYEYQKSSNVFDEQHVQELILISEYVSSVNNEGSRRDDLLPRILTFPYFDISRAVLFSIAREAKDSHQSWAAVLENHDDPKVQSVFALLSRIVSHAETQPLEQIFELYINDSGFKRYYFDEKILHSRPLQYVEFLSSLRVFLDAMREWRQGEMIFMKDVSTFVSLHRNHNIPLISTSPEINSRHLIQIMTAHAAKGLEFGYVYVLSAHDKSWTRGHRGSKVPIPSLLAPIISPAGDTEDDFIRLFYVAITRAKHTLHISGHEPMLRYLPEQEQVVFTERTLTLEQSNSALSGPYLHDEVEVLSSLVKGYRMPVTHLLNFLDITSGGPYYFLEQNLLRFPQPMNVSGVFGSAIHRAVEEMVLYPKFHGGELPDISRIHAIFSHELSRGRLNDLEHKKQLKRGEDVLDAYFETTRGGFTPDDAVEVDMRDAGVVVNGALLSGKLDLLRRTPRGYEVIDFKTGRSYKEWEFAKMTDQEKLKLHRFKQQLVYYKILLSKSARHSKMPVTRLAIQFVESIADAGELIELEYMPTTEEIARMEKLIGAVYASIVSLQFPDIGKYEKTYHGVLEFEKDVINQKIA